MNLKELFDKTNKEDVYNFYKNVVRKRIDYDKVTRREMYKEVIKTFNDDPEIILRLSMPEEVNILKGIIFNDEGSFNNGYIEYLLIDNLKNNFLVVQDGKTLYIPPDIVNYVKMAINVYDEKEYYFRDIMDSVIIGLIRIYNVVELDLMFDILKKYNCVFSSVKVLKEYILKNERLRTKMDIVQVKKIKYVISLEYLFYKDILAIRTSILEFSYTLEELISVGKYKINLFKDQVLKFINFLELHLRGESIDYVVDSLIIYAGMDINDDEVLKRIADGIIELFRELKMVVPFIPNWIYEN